MTAMSMAQETMYLIKGDKVVAKYNVADVDYVSFHLPEGVKEPKEVEISAREAGKNYITYQVETLSPSTNYVHMMILESLFDYILQSYYDTTLEEASQEVIENGIKTCMYSGYGYLGAGTATYSIKDGASDGDGFEFEVLAGQRYLLAACDLASDAELGSVLSYTTITTEAPDQSSGTLSVKYDGLNDYGDAMFTFEYSPEIKRIYTMYGLKSVLDSYIAVKGFDYTLSLFGQSWYPEDITADGNGWPVEGEDEYIMYAVGIDSEGDWVKTSVTQTITPQAKDDKPVISIFSKEKGNGSVKVNFEINPSNVTEAYVCLMDQNTVDDKLNIGYTLAELAASGDAIDITADINNYGEYTYTNSAVPDSWQTLLISGKNADGTSVMRINFHAYIDNSEWDISSSGESNSAKHLKSGVPTMMSPGRTALAPKTALKRSAFKKMR